MCRELCSGFPDRTLGVPSTHVSECCNLFIALPPNYSRAIEERRSDFLISLSSVLYTHLIFSRYSVDIYCVCGWVNAFWHRTSTSVLKDRLDGVRWR